MKTIFDHHTSHAYTNMNKLKHKRKQGF